MKAKNMATAGCLENVCFGFIISLEVKRYGNKGNYIRT